MRRGLAAILLVLMPLPVLAQQPAAPGVHDADGKATPPLQYTGAPPPSFPATVSRDGQGRTTLRAVPLTTPLKVDGNLNEPLYRSYTSVSDFVQSEPNRGQPATERTEVWVAFDVENVYVSVYAHESHPERMIVNEMRRDSTQVLQNENFSFAFDTFYDRRNSSFFNFSPIGGRMDGQNTSEGQYNGDWNPVWAFKVVKVQDGWTGEAAIPFKSLKYRPGRDQIWGVQFRRIDRWKNELSHLTSVPAGLGNTAMLRASAYATLVGIETPPGSRALDIKPYATSSLTSDVTANPTLQNDVGRNAGLDVKYGVTQTLTSDFTLNTDFAQVEADDQQINLTRFSLFFPEKREFFLENQGVFNFGGVTASNAGDVPLLFYSRRIGIDGGHEVPIRAGGRLTGRAGKFTLGGLNIQTGERETYALPSTNFSAVRIKRDLLRRSAVGLLATHRSEMANHAGSTDTYGVDGTFAFFQNLTLNAFWAGTRTPGVKDQNISYRTQFNYNADRWQLNMDRVRVDDNFLPDVGFVRRDNMRKNFLQARFSPRPRKRFRAVRKFNYETDVTYITNGGGRLESRDVMGEVSAELQNSDRADVQFHRGYEYLARPFTIARGVTIPVGGYLVGTTHLEYRFGQQRTASGTWAVEYGPFYGGDRTAVGYSGARVKFTPRLAAEPAIQINRVNLPYGSFTTQLLSTRLTFTPTPMMFVNGLMQYNSSNRTFSTNVRFRWEYQPGSELFVVYSDSRDTIPTGFPDLQSRSLIVKVNRLFRF